MKKSEKICLANNVIFVLDVVLNVLYTSFIAIAGFVVVATDSDLTKALITKTAKNLAQMSLISAICSLVFFIIFYIANNVLYKKDNVKALWFITIITSILAILLLVCNIRLFV